MKQRSFLAIIVPLSIIGKVYDVYIVPLSLFAIYAPLGNYGWEAVSDVVTSCVCICVCVCVCYVQVYMASLFTGVKQKRCAPPCSSPRAEPTSISIAEAALAITARLGKGRAERFRAGSFISVDRVDEVHRSRRGRLRGEACAWVVDVSSGRNWPHRGLAQARVYDGSSSFSNRENNPSSQTCTIHRFTTQDVRTPSVSIPAPSHCTRALQRIRSQTSPPEGFRPHPLR